MPKKINLLIFDLDGTIIDSKRDIANCVHWTLRDLQLPPVADEVVTSYVGNGVRPLIQKSVGGETGPNFKKALKIFKDYYLAHLLDTTRPFPGIEEVLRHFSTKRKAVLTNKPQEFTDPILKGLKLERYFDEVIGAESALPKKPDPAAIHYLLKKCNCPAAEAIIIGDSAVDIQTGRNAGILTCGVLYGFRPADEIQNANPDFVVRKPEEIISLQPS